MSAARIAQSCVTPVTVPRRAFLLHSSGAQWGRFVRTLAVVETDDEPIEQGLAVSERLGGWLRELLCIPTASNTALVNVAQWAPDDRWADPAVMRRPGMD